ncbi:MAG TPA: hypothetical protein VKQ72_04570 [Aggregatilineales bacterium]|nr:hypothetical protein [Aggregatilineales bacterium]
MALERLVKTSDLKTGFLADAAKNKRKSLDIDYDARFDALMLLLVPPETDTIVHYVDDHVALLYRPDDLEIVGIQVEDFERSFLPQHEAVSKVWRLSDSKTDLNDLGDLIVIFDRIKPQVAREVVKATEDILGEPGVELAAALA